MRRLRTETRRLGAAIALTVVFAPQLAATAGEAVVGEVRAVYVRAEGSAHLLLQQGFGAPSPAPAWLEVAPRSAHAAAIIAPLPAGADAAPGDVVELRILAPAPRAIPSGLLGSPFDSVGGHAAAPTGEVIRFIEQRRAARRTAEATIVAQGERLYLRTRPTATPAGRTEIATATVTRQR
jgi:hypothetical protein